MDATAGKCLCWRPDPPVAGARERMKRCVLLWCLWLPLLAQAQEEPKEPKEPTLFEAIEAALGAGDFARVKMLAEEALAAGDMDRDTRGRAHLAIALARIAGNENEAARAELDTALALLDRPAGAHYERFKLAYGAQDWPTAAKDLAAIARLRPDLAIPVHLSAVETIRRGAISWGEEEAAFELGLALARIGYAGGPGGGDRPDVLYRDIALGLAERGRLFEAEVALERIFAFDTLLPMLLDQRYAPLWRSLDAKFASAATALTRHVLEATTELRNRFPNSLEVVRDHMKALRRHGLPEQAVQLGGQVMQAVRLDTLDPARAAEVLWILNELAYALLEVGQPDAAIALMDRVAELDLRRYPSLVNQRINRGAVLLEVGRFDEAIDAVHLATGLAVSGYGRMFIEQINVCAHFEAGRPSEAELAMAFLTDRPMVNPRATQIALLCLDRHEQAVEHMLARLADPRTRDDALIALVPQDLSLEKSALFRKLHERLDRVRKDPRVQAAQAEAGRALTIALRPIYWGTF